MALFWALARGDASGNVSAVVVHVLEDLLAAAFSLPPRALVPGDGSGNASAVVVHVLEVL
eukprot:CAMPEP_0183417748 /NCGR_PEP_ID=MMETSP0370-20130417/24642_1 /TAXON_ID=268820 /ORGANISM="Peridinium aciculiferum, Strain PAER-2" /LENGTH=59 /DNA_ID=CAMNT_0025601369 /DNA_START=214 /DNA_END=389 /DNA_ORIENTATION=-